MGLVGNTSVKGLSEYVCFVKV